MFDLVGNFWYTRGMRQCKKGTKSRIGRSDSQDRCNFAHYFTQIPSITPSLQITKPVFSLSTGLCGLGGVSISGGGERLRNMFHELEQLPTILTVRS